jgi:outer membrane lipoprotein-sorting protein
MRLRMSRFDAWANWPEIYESAVVEGSETLDGKNCYRLSLQPKGGGKTETVWFDSATGLIVKSNYTLQTPMGEIGLEITVSDYRDTGGIKTPWKMVQMIGPQSIVINIRKVEPNVELPASTFEPPAEIKELLAKRNAKGS